MKPIKIAIQKSGRLNEKSVEILKKSGLSFENYKSSLISSCNNFPLEFLFLRDDDIPEYVQDIISKWAITFNQTLKEESWTVDYFKHHLPDYDLILVQNQSALERFMLLLLGLNLKINDDGL